MAWLVSYETPRDHHESERGRQRVWAPFPAVVWNLADKEVSLCGCQAGLRQEGSWGLVCPLSIPALRVETPAPQGLWTTGPEAGKGRDWAASGYRVHQRTQESLFWCLWLHALVSLPGLL
jgi:hypothetical protein